MSGECGWIYGAIIMSMPLMRPQCFWQAFDKLHWESLDTFILNY